MLLIVKKKPVEVQAMQLKPENIKEVLCFIYGHEAVNLDAPEEMTRKIAKERWLDYESSVIREGLRLKTRESHNETQIASMGDYIIKGVKGEFYPCKPDIFLLTYDIIEQKGENNE